MWVAELRVWHEGGVLVSWSTNPNMVPGMRTAGAIVTEMGGVASHAAIVSREFNIPCVVGVKGAQGRRAGRS